jgi:hypothetical protein
MINLLIALTDLSYNEQMYHLTFSEKKQIYHFTVQWKEKNMHEYCK